MTDRPPTPPATLHRARRIGLEAGLRHVYLGNLPGAGGEETTCPHCGNLLVERHGYLVRSVTLTGKGRCPECGTPIAGVWKG